MQLLTMFLFYFYYMQFTTFIAIIKLHTVFILVWSNLWICNSNLIFWASILCQASKCSLQQYCCVSAVHYLAVQAHPAAIEGMFTQSGGSTQVIFPCGGIDYFQAFISHCPVHTKVWCFSWLTSLCITNSYKTWKHDHKGHKGEWKVILYHLF